MYERSHCAARRSAYLALSTLPTSSISITLARSRRRAQAPGFLGKNEAVVDPVKDGLAKRAIRHPVRKGAQCSAERVTQVGGHGNRLPALTRRVIRNCR
jgi:hypothetical protein